MKRILHTGQLSLRILSRRLYRAAVVHAYDEPLTIKDVKERSPKDSQILIKNELAGFNHADWSMIKGKYHVRPPFPFTPGFESLGTVEQVGKKVKDFQEGDRVLAIRRAGTGAFAEKAIADEKEDIIIKVPYSIDADLAPTLSAYGLAYLGLKKLVMENKGNSFLITSAEGTVGYAAMDLVQNVFEGVVLGASNDEEKLAVFREANVMSTLNWTDGKLAHNVREKTFGKGVDFVVDTVGGDIFLQALHCVKVGGHILSLAFSSGEFPQVDLLDLHRLNASLTAVWLSGRDRAEIVEALDMIKKLFEDDFLQGIRVEKYPLADINKCVNDVVQPGFFGKAVVTMYD